MPYLIQCEACTRQMSISENVFTQRISGKKVALRCKHCEAVIKIDGTGSLSGIVHVPADAPKAEPTAAEKPAPAAPAVPRAGEAGPRRTNTAPRPLPPAPPIPTRSLTPPGRKAMPLGKTLLGMQHSPFAGMGPAMPPIPAPAITNAPTATPAQNDVHDAEARKIASPLSVDPKRDLPSTQPPPPGTAQAPLEPPLPSPALLPEVDAAPAPTEAAVAEHPAPAETSDRPGVPRESDHTPWGAVTSDKRSPASTPAVVRDRPSGKKGSARLVLFAAAVLGLGAAGAYVGVTQGLIPGASHAATQLITRARDLAAAPAPAPAAPTPAAPAEAPAVEAPVATAELVKAAVVAEAPPPPSATAAESGIAKAAAEEPTPAAAVAATAPTAESPPSSAGIPAYVSEPVVLQYAGVAMRRAQRCHPGGHAVGTADVFITFGQDGRPTDARIEGEPIASAPVAKCILDHARSIFLPKFEGEPFTLRQQVTLK